MATKVSIPVGLERRLRDPETATSAVRDVVALLDEAQSKVKAAGVPAQVAVNMLSTYKPLIEPPKGPAAGRAYARLAKALRDYGVTPAQISSLGQWLAGQHWLKDVTVERLASNLGDWLSRAVAAVPATEFRKAKWEDG